MDANDEIARQAELDALELTSLTDTAYDDLTRLAADTFDVPMSAITIIDQDRQWFKSKVGLDVSETPRSWAFCDHTIRTPDEVLVVEDATQDPRFRDNPLVTGPLELRFYAGAPLRLASGRAIGALCVMDTKPHRVDPEKIETLRFLSEQVIATLVARRKVKDF